MKNSPEMDNFQSVFRDATSGKDLCAEPSATEFQASRFSFRISRSPVGVVVRIPRTDPEVMGSKLERRTFFDLRYFQALHGSRTEFQPSQLSYNIE